MQSLLAFWRRNTLNKLIIVALVGLLCCCPIVFSGARGRGVAQVVTATPTTPRPTPAPTRAPTATPEPSGLGVTPDQMRDVLSSFGFQFQSGSALRDGTPRQIGVAPDRTSVELIGPEGGLTQITILAGVPLGDEETQARIGSYIGTIVNFVAFEHQEEITTWVIEQLRATAAGEDITGRTLDTGDVRSAVTTIPASDGIALTYSIEVKP